MSRKVGIYILDEETQNKVEGVTTIKQINELYDKFKVNGLTEIVRNLNKELTIYTGKEEDFSIPLF